MNENEMAMTCGVETFLESIGLHSYTSTFLAKGFDRETDLQHLGDEDLDTMLILDPGHRRSLISAARKHKPSEDGMLLQWLREYELEHYFIGFVRSELVEMEEIARLNLPDSNIYDELEISMPGHQRRLERAVRQLNKRRKHEENAELPVTEGFWGKPTNLEDAKYDFLCVEATISSTRDSSRYHTIDFMVDSGSDVTTLQEELLYTLNPELIGPINSKGVHSSCRKNLYRAKLTVGTHDLEIEVMGESYNSLGSRVLRHFRHYITGSKHIWLPGDYFDPVMSTNLKMLSEEQKTEEIVDPTALLNETSSSEPSNGETSMDLSKVGHEEFGVYKTSLEHETSSNHETPKDHETSSDHETSRDHQLFIAQQTPKDRETLLEQTGPMEKPSKTHQSSTDQFSLQQKDLIDRTLSEEQSMLTTGISSSEVTGTMISSKTREQLSVDEKYSIEQNVNSEKDSSFERTMRDTSVSSESRTFTGERHEETLRHSKSSEERTESRRLLDGETLQESATDETDNMGTMTVVSHNSKSALSYRKHSLCDSNLYNEGCVIPNFRHENTVQSLTNSTFHKHGLKCKNSAEDRVGGLSLHNGNGTSDGLYN